MITSYRYCVNRCFASQKFGGLTTQNLACKIDDPLKMADQGRSDFSVVFIMSLRALGLKQLLMFAISNHTTLISGVRAVRNYLKLICEYELHSLPNKKVSRAKDHGKNYIKVRPPLGRHLLRNRLY